MRHRACLVLFLIAFAIAPPAFAQKTKQKDPVLQAYLEETFADLNAKLLKLSDRLTAIEEDLAKIKQQEASAAEDIRNTLAQTKANDGSLTSFRVSTQQDIINIKQDLAKVKQDLAGLVDATKKPEAPAAPGAEAPKIEGYITAVTKDEVTINLGSAAGMKVGTRLNVFRSTDAKTQIGIVEIVEVLDANNSRAKIVSRKSDVTFEFSDIVRPE